MKKIVVFGATGGIGAYTILHLLDTNKFELVAVGHRKSDNGFFESLGIGGHTQQESSDSQKSLFHTEAWLLVVLI